MIAHLLCFPLSVWYFYFSYSVIFLCPRRGAVYMEWKPAQALASSKPGSSLSRPGQPGDLWPGTHFEVLCSHVIWEAWEVIKGGFQVLVLSMKIINTQSITGIEKSFI